MNIKRRSLVAGSAASLLMPKVPAFAQNDIRLRDLGDRIGLEIGSIHTHDLSRAEAKLIEQHCSIITPENGMKTSWLYITSDTPEWLRNKTCQRKGICFCEADKAYGFAKKSKLDVHGHTISWPKHRLPTADGLQGRAFRNAWRQHIETLIERYRDVLSWDILNEVLVDSMSALQEKGWRALKKDPHLGTDPDVLIDHYVFLIETIREMADKHGAKVRLVLNETDLNGDKKDGYHDYRRAAVLELVYELARRGAPIDAVGIQCHFKSSSPPSGYKVAKLSDSLAELNIVTHMSELDFEDDKPSEPRDYNNKILCSTAENIDTQAQIVGPFLHEVLQRPTVKRLTFWGLTDSNHWFQRDEVKKKLGLKPTLFDKEGEPKPVFKCVADAIAAAPKRTV